MCKITCEWFDSSSRLKVWELIDKEDATVIKACFMKD